MHVTQPQDELTTCVLQAVQGLSVSGKAELLLQRALTLIAEGRYGEEVERYLDVYLRTHGLSLEQKARAHLARGRARRTRGENLSSQALQDFKSVIAVDPENREALYHLKCLNQLTPQHQSYRERTGPTPAHRRAPPEVWSRIASFIPRYHLRTWLSVSGFHREVALTQLFRTLDLYFGDEDNLHRGMDVFDRVKHDSRFASRVLTLRIHWSFEEGDMLDVMLRIFRDAMPAFTALTEFEWIGYPELRKELVSFVLSSHPRLQSLGLMGWHFDAEGVSGFTHLKKFTLRAEDDDGFADMGEVRTVLDANAATLKHLCLGAYLLRDHSWDPAFQSATIWGLTHLDLVDTRISHFVFSKIAHAQQLRSLTLHGTFEEPSSASVVFGSDHIIDGQHTFLPRLRAFRFVLVGHDEDHGLFQNVCQFLRDRGELRRLDLGRCPWEMVSTLLPSLPHLTTLRAHIPRLNWSLVHSFKTLLPLGMRALHFACVDTEVPIEEYAPLFKPFRELQMLHLQHSLRKRPQIANMMSSKEHAEQLTLWNEAAKSVASVIPSLDFFGWNGEHHVIVRTDSSNLEAKSEGARERVTVKLKELPSRRRLDCSKGVDLGSADAWWMERKDVPIDYELPSSEATN